MVKGGGEIGGYVQAPERHRSLASAYKRRAFSSRAQRAALRKQVGAWWPEAAGGGRLGRLGGY